MDIANKQCVPCRGGIPPLTAAEAETHLANTPHWTLLENATRMQRTYKFSNFVEALAFVNAVAELSEAQGHHPDITFGWGYVTVLFYTHKIKGLHENDFIMAAKTDTLFDAG